MNFQTKLAASVKKNNSLLCVGLDSDVEKIPQHLFSQPDPVFTFNQAIIDATHDLVCCYKINTAFYEGQGAEGIKQLKMTFDYLKEKCADIPIILDAKRGDIENTNSGSVKFAFDYLGADAVTLNNYLGKEALEPFLKLSDKGLFILCRTSNPGAGEIQDLNVGGRPLYFVIAEKVVKEWNKQGNCMLVVGPSPKEISEIRQLVGNIVLLVPGIGAQGGDLQQTLKAGLTAEKSGLIIHSARSIIYAGGGQDFAELARQKATKLREQINKTR